VSIKQYEPVLRREILGSGDTRSAYRKLKKQGRELVSSTNPTR